jgi:hypothetical protein
VTDNGRVLTHNYAQAHVADSAVRKLAIQLAQASLDKAFAEANLELLTEYVRSVVETTQWVNDDNGVLTPVVAAEPLQALQTLLVLSQG